MRFLTWLHIHTLFALLIKKNPLKMGIQGPNLYMFLWYPKSKLFLKSFSRNLKSQKICMPKKMMPKSQVKNKTPFPQYPFLAIF